MTAQRKVYVIGAGGHAKVVLGTLQRLGYAVAGIFDDDPGTWGQSLLDAPVIGQIDRVRQLPRLPAVIAIGDNVARRGIAERFHLDWMSAVDPKAWVDPSAELGPGTVLLPGAVVQVDSRLGGHVIVNTNASVDHDGTVGDYAHVGPGAHLSGNVRVGEGAMMGTGSCTIQGVRIGRWTTIGAGGVVIRDLPDVVVAVGSPARVIRSGQLQKKVA